MSLLIWALIGQISKYYIANLNVSAVSLCSPVTLASLLFFPGEFYISAFQRSVCPLATNLGALIQESVGRAPPNAFTHANPSFLRAGIAVFFVICLHQISYHVFGNIWIKRVKLLPHRWLHGFHWQCRILLLNIAAS